MTHLIFLLSMTAFIAFFRAIQYPWFAVFPIIAILFFTANSLVEITPSTTLKTIIEKNSLYISWILILLGLSGILYFLQTDLLYISFYLMGINLLLWLGSYITQYEDGKSLFHVTYYISYIVFIIAISLIAENNQAIIDVIAYSVPIHFLLYLFITFGIGRLYPISQGTQGITYAFFHLTILRIGSYIFREVSMITLVLLQCYLLCVYYATNTLLGYEKKAYSVKNIGAKEILAGQKVLEHQKRVQTLQQSSDIRPKFKYFLENLHPQVGLFIDSYNSILIGLIIIFYLVSFTSSIPLLQEQALYWFSIILFFINFITIQKHRTLPKIQRIFVFLIINFAIYTNIIFLGGQDFATIATLGVIRNVLNSLLILYSKDIIPDGLIQLHDYRYWIIVNIIGIPINIYFLSKLYIDGSLLFALISIYLGLQGFLLFYNIKYIKQKVI